MQKEKNKMKNRIIVLLLGLCLIGCTQNSATLTVQNKSASMIRNLTVTLSGQGNIKVKDTLLVNESCRFDFSEYSDGAYEIEFKSESIFSDTCCIVFRDTLGYVTNGMSFNDTAEIANDSMGNFSILFSSKAETKY
jgi:hypothetical protein